MFFPLHISSVEIVKLILPKRLRYITPPTPPPPLGPLESNKHFGLPLDPIYSTVNNKIKDASHNWSRIILQFSDKAAFSDRCWCFSQGCDIDKILHHKIRNSA